MRTQEEISKMIRTITEHGSDPSGVQRKTLFHKLTWSNAVKYLPPEKQTAEYRKKFEEMSKLDPKALLEEMVERIDQLFMFLADGDAVRIHIHLQMILVYLWLMGESRRGDFNWLYGRLSTPNANHRRTGRELADVFNLNWKVLEMRYP